ncbi:MAG: flagellar motor switch protein FliG [Planctomycetes bacterium]|nr:flagellar motor switch protein FliG [Planctomycetota bacterium]
MAHNPENLSPLAKAAILLVSVDTEVAARLMASLEQDQVEQVSMEVARLGDVPAGVRQEVLEEFYQRCLASHYIEEGGMEYARTLLERSLSAGDASRVLDDLEQTIYGSPFRFLQKTDPANIAAFVQDEHPQTIALVLSYLPGNIGGHVLENLPARKQVEVARRIATMEQTSPETIREVEQGLSERLSAIMGQNLRKTGGVASVAELLNSVSRATEKSILESIEEENPDLAESIRKQMFTFGDLLLVNDKGIQSLLKEIEPDELALALKTATQEVKDKIFGNMSERAGTNVKEEMEYMGPVRITDVETAQQRIVDIVRRLEEAGELIIEGRGSEEIVE